MDEKEKPKSKFIVTIFESGNVDVKVKGEHIDKRTFNRIIKSLGFAYKKSIREYRLSLTLKGMKDAGREGNKQLVTEAVKRAEPEGDRSPELSTDTAVRATG